jgi:hypothetical protein
MGGAGGYTAVWMYWTLHFEMSMKRVVDVAQ